jgi:hypothetical protein
MAKHRKEPAAKNLPLDPWNLNENVRHRRIREDAKRPMAVNLAEGLALSEFMAKFKGVARR